MTDLLSVARDRNWGEGGERGGREGKGGEGLVLRPTPRSMLPSEVPVGGGCAEFPTVRTFSSPRVSTLPVYFPAGRISTTFKKPGG